jgi:flagellar basal body-associated protein FliL
MDRILNDRLNTSAAKKKIHAMRAQLRREINEGTDKNEGTDQVALFELGLKDPEEILNEDLAKYNKQLRDFLIEYSSKPSEAAREFIELHGNGVVDGKLYSEVVDNFQAHAKKAGQIVGATAMTALDITL